MKRFLLLLTEISVLGIAGLTLLRSPAPPSEALQPLGPRPVSIETSALEAELRSSPPGWWKTNLHTHTTNSDGDSAPIDVARWYASKGYDALVLSDHNVFTEVKELQQQLDAERKDKARRLLLIPGEEVTDRYGRASIHVNAIGCDEVIAPQPRDGRRATLQADVDAIRKAGAIPVLNHPNFGWSLEPDDFAQMKGLRHFELHNAHPSVNNLGGGGRPGMEEIWDELLSGGSRIFGVATDDAHNLKTWGRRRSNPGRAWIMIESTEPTRAALLASLDAGRFYASTGVVFESLSLDEGRLRYRLTRDGDERFDLEVIGQGGKVLARPDALEGEYKLGEGDLYARLRVRSSRGELAWTQPLFAKKR